MKRVFGQEILNNVSKEIQEMMESQEKQIKARLEKRTLRLISSFYAESPIAGQRSKATSVHASPRRSPNKKQVVNPMITILFVGMVFKSWKRYTEHSISGELDSHGSVVLPPGREEEDSEESEEFSEDSDSEDSEDSDSEGMMPIEENEDEGSEEESSKPEDEEAGKAAEGRRQPDRQRLAFSAIGKFISRKRMAESAGQNAGLDAPREEPRARKGSNMFRTFFASNENKIKLQNT